MTAAAIALVTSADVSFQMVTLYGARIVKKYIAMIAPNVFYIAAITAANTIQKVAYTMMILETLYAITALNVIATLPATIAGGF